MIQETGHGKAVDWWSLGIIIFKMMTGDVPFDSPHKKELYDMILTKEVEFPSYMSRDAKKLIQAVCAAVIVVSLLLVIIILTICSLVLLFYCVFCYCF